MQIKYWCAIVVYFGTMLMACLHIKQKSTVSRIIHDYKEELNDLTGEVHKLLKLVKSDADRVEVQKQFRRARLSYKNVEWLAEYYYPYTAKKINGPALDEVEPDEKSIVVNPEGFQVIEEILFEKDAGHTRSEMLQQVNVLRSNVGRLHYMISLQETTDAHIFDALRLELFRIIALGISGFDSPVDHHSLQEAAASLKSIRHILSFYSERLTPNDKHLNEQTQALLTAAAESLSSASDFDSFDRMKLIKQFLDPVCEKILALQIALNISNFSEPRVLRADAKSLFARDIFNTDFYTPNSLSYSSPEKIKLGEKLFYDGILSGDGKRSCATCHQPGNAFTDGLTTSFALNGKTSVRRNAPTLINAALQPSLFYDLRVNYLEDQATDVISNKDEMHGSLDAAVRYVSKDSAYRKLFRAIYKDEQVSGLHIKNGIAAYIRSIIRMNSRFDRFMRGNDSAMNKKEIAGFNLFTGKAKCGTCHFVPLFNGTNPPGFNKIDAEVIGVPATADTLHPALDQDPGLYDLFKVKLHKNAFKTPTLRNIEVTGPYMHNGVFKTLEEVVDFYDRGGGNGLGLEVPNQTLPKEKLNLSAYEKESLIAFMKTLTDTTAFSTPYPYSSN